MAANGRVDRASITLHEIRHGYGFGISVTATVEYAGTETVA